MEEWPEITKETSLEEVRKIHKRIWDYVVEHGYKPDTPYFSDCVLCQWICLNTEGLYCHSCPAMWGSDYCCNIGTLYSKWLDDEDYTENKKKIAEQIRDIPFKGIDA